MHKQGELTSKDTGLQSTYLTILSMYFHVLYQSNNYQFFLFHVSPTLPRGRVIDEEISRAFQQLECEDIHWDSVFYEVNPAVWQQLKNKSENIDQSFTSVWRFTNNTYFKSLMKINFLTLVIFARIRPKVVIFTKYIYEKFISWPLE